MTIRRRAGASGMAALGFSVFSWIASTSCQRPAPAAPAPPASVDAAKVTDSPKGASNLDRAISLLEERTGERLSLVLSEHDYGAVYPAWLPDNRLIVPGNHGATIVEPRSGSTTAIAASGRRAVVSSDGKTMAIASSALIELLDVASGQSLATLEASIGDNAEGALQFSPDGRLFAFLKSGAGETNPAIGLYDVAKGAMRGALELGAPERRPQGLTAKFARSLEPGDGVTTFELRDERLVGNLSSGGTALWDTASLQLLLLLAGDKNDAQSPEHRALLSADGSFAAAWAPVEGAPGTKVKTAPGVTTSDAPSRGALRAERRGALLLVDARLGEVVMRLDDKSCTPFGIAMHPREPLLAVGSLYPGFCVWDLAQRKIKRRFRIPQTMSKDKVAGAGLMLRLAAKMSPKMDLPIEQVAFDAAGERLTLGIAHLGGIVVRLSDGTVSDGALSKDSHLEEAPAGGPSATSPDRSMIAGSGNEVRVWDVASGRVLRRMGQHEKHALLAWTADGLTVIGVDGTAVRFHAGTGELAERRPRPTGFDEVKTVSNGAGMVVMLSSRPSGLRAMRLDDPGKVVSLAWQGTMDGILAAAVSGNGQRLAVAAPSALAVFDATTGAALRAIEPRGPRALESRAPTDVALDDEGLLVAAIVQDTPRLWEVPSGKEIALSPGDCSDLKFQPKTHLLVGSCRDKTRVWDGRTGTLVSAFDSGDLPEGLFFDAAGERMAQIGAKYVTLLDGRTLTVLHKTESTLPTWTAVFSPSARFVAVGVQDGEGVEFYRVADGKRLARLQLWPNDEAWIVRTEEGAFEILGDVERAGQGLECRVGQNVFPLAACESRFLVKGLLGKILSEKFNIGH